MKFLGETLVQVSLLALLYVAGGSTAAWQPTLDCQTKCGNLTIEYPFGTSPGCYHDESFLITCNQTGTEQKPFLRKGNIEVINISLNGELRILMNSSRACYNKTGTLIDYQDHHIQLTHFALSIKNKITAVGCDSYVYLNNMGVRDSSTGCLSVCNSTPPNDGLCSGDGCCQTPIPIGTSYFAVKPYSFNNHTDVFQFNPCSYAFLVEDGSFNFSASKDLVNLRNTTRFPVVVDWSIGDRKCDQIDNNNSSCRENSICVNSTSGSGYTCECKKGFEGNPYLGCQDIDECSKDKHTCAKQEICHNNIGSFHCKKRQELSIIVLGKSIIVFLIFLLGVCGLKLKLESQKHTKLREKHFERNGGIMLRQLLSADSSNEIKIFIEEEIKIATNGYHESRMLGKGGQGIVYKGILSDNSEVAIKKSLPRIGDPSNAAHQQIGTQVAEFINEVIILSRITDTKVVKLIGCCLETEVPFLVYEFVSGGTLSDNLHGSKSGFFLQWKDRLRIATEIATTLASLHSAQVPIIHRDVKPTNILLDEELSVKVADFGASRLVPANKEQLTTLVLGTFGYLDPEYMHTRTFSEKSDVYSFKVVLMELVSGEKALCFNRPQNEKNLVIRLNSALKENRLDEVIDKTMVNGVNHMEIQKAALLAVRCTAVKGEERPKMKEVAAELEGLGAPATKRFVRSVSGF
ncbi:unnamed protein product [Arabidopsis lyrata]|nr:unnamed protein product [Arabidopsis lyrata]